MKLKHLSESRGLLIYQRRYPQRLLAHPQIKTPLFKRSLELKADAPEEAILSAWKAANKLFVDYVTLLGLSNAQELEQARKIELARALLAANDLKPGLLAEDPMMSKEQNKALRGQQLDAVLETNVFEDLSHFHHPEWSDGLTPDLEIQSIAWKLINEPKEINANLMTLSSCWDIYSSIRNVGGTSQNLQMAKARFQQFIRLTGDQLLTQQTCNAGLIKYVEDREQQRQAAQGNTPSESTIHRELNIIIAVLNTAIKRKGLDINIRRPALQKTAKASRCTLTKAELIALVNLSQNLDDRLYEPWKELMILIMVQTGVIQSELLRLRKTALHLDHQVPHIDLRGELKTTDRERPNPIVYRVERMKELMVLLDDGTDFVFGRLAKKEPKTVNKALVRLVRRVNPKASPYSCRHAFKNNALGAGVNPQLLAALGGWSGKELGFNSIMSDYGKTGLKHLETLQQLREAMLKINSHLLAEGGQVVRFPVRA
jgi:integrase